MSRKRKHLLVSVCLVAIGVLSGMVAKRNWDARYFEGYDPSLPLVSGIEQEEAQANIVRVEFDFIGTADEIVPALLLRPREAKQTFPCVIFLHGIGQSKEYIEEISTPFLESGFAPVSFDQYTRGERRLVDAGPLRQLLALRRRGALTVIETRRLIDYLETQVDIDPHRIYLVGASFGAITGATAAAFDNRIRAAVLTYGGGLFSSLFASEAAAEAVGTWRGPLRYLLAFLFAPADPIHYVDRISPRPVLFQNGTHDSIVPEASAKALFAAAREPKKMVWYESDHVGMDPDLVVQIVHDAVSWLCEIDHLQLAKPR